MKTAPSHSSRTANVLFCSWRTSFASSWVAAGGFPIENGMFSQLLFISHSWCRSLLHPIDHMGAGTPTTWGAENLSVFLAFDSHFEMWRDEIRNKTAVESGRCLANSCHLESKCKQNMYPGTRRMIWHDCYIIYYTLILTHLRYITLYYNIMIPPWLQTRNSSPHTKVKHIKVRPFVVCSSIRNLAYAYFRFGSLSIAQGKTQNRQRLSC